jgi:nicotinate-nucleotide adenylyltransferase
VKNVPPVIADVIAQRGAHADVLQATPHGHLLIDESLAYDVSATDIRAELRASLEDGAKKQNNADSARNQVPAAVWDYIVQHHLYHR